MFNPALFFALVRPLFAGGKMTTDQVAGIQKILDYWYDKWMPHNGDLSPNIRWLAYMLATTFLESGQKMQPVTELGGLAYLKRKPYYPYYGRGLGQNTWDYNYKAWSVRLGVDLLKTPDLALQWDYALPMLMDSMARGYWTGRRLGQYFGADPAKDNPVLARAIVNGTDRAADVAAYYRVFLNALTQAKA